MLSDTGYFICREAPAPPTAPPSLSSWVMSSATHRTQVVTFKSFVTSSKCAIIQGVSPHLWPLRRGHITSRRASQCKGPPNSACSFNYSFAFFISYFVLTFAAMIPGEGREMNITLAYSCILHFHCLQMHFARHENQYFGKPCRYSFFYSTVGTGDTIF